MAYYLPQHVFFCTVDVHCIFLDVERDLYVAVPKIRIDSLLPWLSARPDTRNASALHDMPSILALVAHDLASQGLLTLDELTGKSFESVNLPVPRAASIPRQSVICNARRFSTFYRACEAANRRLTDERTSDTVNLIRQRKTQRSTDAQARGAPLMSLVSTFHALRLLYPRPYLCLFDSLALLEFLAAYRIFPTWIFGVQGEPFNAHCWVQHGDLLLNDSLHRVSRLTPIMAV